MDYLNIIKLDRIFHYEWTDPGMVFRPRRVDSGIQEVEVLSKGTGYFAYDGVEYKVSTGGMIWYYPGEVIHARADKVNPYHTFVFRFHIKTPPETRPPFLSWWPDTGECLNFCHQALQHYDDSVRNNKEEDTAFTKCLYSRFYWQAQYTGNRQQPDQPTQVKNAIRFIEQNFRDNISAADIARASNTSLSHLHALFRKHCSLSIKQSLLHYRLQEAKNLLLISSYSIKEIAHACGFNSANNFCYFFRKATGTSPEKYRHIII